MLAYIAGGPTIPDSHIQSRTVLYSPHATALHYYPTVYINCMIVYTVYGDSVATIRTARISY